MNTPALILSTIWIVLLHASCEASECPDSISIDERVAQLNQTLARLAKLQRLHGTQVNDIISKLSTENSWSKIKEYELRQQFLNSNAYLLLQAKRRPNDIILEKTKTLLRNELGENSYQLTCQEANAAASAAEANFRLNEQEIKVAEEFLASAK